MKQIKFLILLLCFPGLALPASEKKSSFLFAEYQKAEVVYLNGTQTDETVNYNLTDEKLYFIDKADGQVKILTDVSTIAVIRISERSYVLDDKGLREILFTDPVEFSVQYKAKLQTENPSVGYGGTSSVASVSTYTDFREGGQQTVAKEPAVNVSTICKCYWIVKGKKRYSFMDRSHFLKIYVQKKVKLTEYIERLKIDFDNVTQVIGLVKYAETACL